MKKSFKRLVAYVASLTMVVTSITGYQAKNVNAATDAPEGYTVQDEGWASFGELVASVNSEPISKWAVYSAESWAGSIVATKGGTDTEDTLSVFAVQNGQVDEWGIQVARVFTGLTTGTNYDYTINYTLDGVAQTVKNSAAADADGNIVVVVPLGNTLAEGKVAEFTSTSVEEAKIADYVDGGVLVSETNVSKPVGAIAGGDLWQAEYNNAPVKYDAGKYYVAEVVVSSDVTKTIKLVFQNTDGWSFIDTASGYEYTIKAGEKVKITYVFSATQSTVAGNFDIYLGYPAAAANLEFESKKLTTYTTVPDGVVTGVEVLEAGEEPTPGEGETSTTEAPTDPAETTWTEVDASNKTLYYANVNNMTMVNVQQPAWAGESGVYMYSSQGIESVAINGVVTDKAAIDGAGAVVYTSAFTSEISKVEFLDGNGNAFASVDIKNANASGGEEPSTPEETESESESESVSTPATDVANITINAVEKPAGQIDATWTNPEVEYTEQRHYLNKAGEVALDANHYAKAGNGWVWSTDNPKEKRTGLDTVAGTMDGSISVADGGDFVIVVQLLNENGEVVAQGTSNTVTVVKSTNKDLALFVERYDASGMWAFLKWTPIGGAAEYAICDEDGNVASTATGDWGQVKVPAYDQDYTYTVKVLDAAGNEIDGITNNVVTVNCSAWVKLGNGIGEERGNGYSYYYAHTAKNIMNVQKPAWEGLLDSGVYIEVPAGINADGVSVNGVTGDSVAYIMGAGVLVYLSALTKNINEIVIEYAGGTAEVKIKNDNVAAGETVIPEEDDIQIAGWQIAAGTLTVNGNTYDGGVRTVYSIDKDVLASATEVGLIYGLGGYAADADMTVESASAYVKKAVASDAGKINETYAGYEDEQLYAMIMASNLSAASVNALKQEYMVRAYVVIDGVAYYSNVATYSTVAVAQYLYDNGSMQTADGHAYICALINKVNPGTATKEFTLVNPPVVKPSEGIAE